MPLHPIQLPVQADRKVARPGTVLGNQVRAAFVASVLAICGDTRLLWLPKTTSTTTVTDESLNASVFTEGNTLAGRLSNQGSGIGASYNGTTDYATVPDAANLSFGDSVVDVPMSIVIWCNVTNTAAQRYLLSKEGSGSNNEWVLTITSADKLQMMFYDKSANATIDQTSSSAITQGSVQCFGGTYAGDGATTGITLYANGLAITRTATTSGTYVAMENTTSGVALGTRSNADGAFFSGTAYFIVLCAKELSQSEMWNLKTLGNSFFGLTL